MRNAAFFLGAIVVGAVAGPRLWQALQGPRPSVAVLEMRPAVPAPAASRQDVSPKGAAPSTPSIDELLREADPARRAAMQEAILASIDPDKVSEFLAEAAARPISRARDQWVTRLFVHWGSLNPAAALEAARRAAPPERHLREDDVLAGWVARDPAAAWQWAQEHPSPAEWTGLPRGALRLEHLVLTLFDLERPEEALRLLASVEDPRLTQRSLSILLGRMANFDLAHAVDIVGGLPSSPLKTNATVGILGWLGQEDPLRAGAIAAGFEDSAARERAFSAALTPSWNPQVVQKDPELPRSVLRWVLDLPAGPVRDSALAASVPRMLSREPSEIDAALGAFADPAIRQRVFAAAVTGLSPARGNEAMDLIVRNAPALERLSLMKTVVARWAVRSANDARTYVTTNPGLADAERAELLGLVPEN